MMRSGTRIYRLDRTRKMTGRWIAAWVAFVAIIIVAFVATMALPAEAQACRDINATRSVSVTASEVDSGGLFTVTVSWNDHPGDNHFVVVTDRDGLGRTLDSVGSYTFDATNGPFTWQGVNERYGERYCKGQGSLPRTFVPPTTTTTVPETTTTTEPENVTSTTEPDTPTTTTTTPNGSTTTVTTPTTSTTIPPVTGSTLPFTGPEDDAREIAMLAVIGLILGAGVVKLAVKTR